jgi:hypothetical protein
MRIGFHKIFLLARIVILFEKVYLSTKCCSKKISENLLALVLRFDYRQRLTVRQYNRENYFHSELDFPKLLGEIINI